MSPTIYHILHLLSLLVLTGYTFYAFAAPGETRKGVLIVTGSASLVMLVTGFGMLHDMSLGFPGWAIVKLVCWLGVSAMSGIAYRKRVKVCLLRWITLILVTVAVTLVYTKPF